MLIFLFLESDTFILDTVPSKTVFDMKQCQRVSFYSGTWNHNLKS